MARLAYIRFLLIQAAMLSVTGVATEAQETILDRNFSFREGEVRTGTALGIISRRTGYYFTYDSGIIDPEARVRLVYDNVPLLEILKGVLRNDSLKYTLISNHIIISRHAPVRNPAAIEEEKGGIIRIEGRITDSETGDPLPFATVAVINKPRGTVSNIDGRFLINITEDYIDDTLSFSYLGYLNRYIPVRNMAGNDFTIAMLRDYIPIPEIIIRSQIPQEIIRKSVEAVPLNYGVTPAAMWGFYREGIKKGRSIQVYSEAVVRIYKASYTSQSDDQVKVERSRKIENVGSTDTLVLRLKAGLSSSLMLDGVKNRYDFMDNDFMGLYNYRMTDIVTIDDAAAYVIEFEQKQGVREPLFRGSVMINTVDYAVIQAEFEYNPSFISGRKENFVSSPSKGFTIRPTAIKYRVGYKKAGDRYYLNHVRGDLRFSARNRRSLFNSTYDVFFEMAITSAVTDNVTRFDRAEIIPPQTVFSRTIKGYDSEFWGNFDFLNPEEDLIKSLNAITIKLSGYTGDGGQNLSIIR